MQRILQHLILSELKSQEMIQFVHLLLHKWSYAFFDMFYKNEFCEIFRVQTWFLCFCELRGIVQGQLECEVVVLFESS